MQPHASSLEIDPSIEAITAVERQHELENQRRAEISRLITEEAVPTYEQLVAAKDWAADIRTRGTFDSQGNLEQEAGLSPVTEQMITDTESYFDERNWILGKKELQLAVDINHTPGKVGLFESIKKVSPELAEALSEDLDQLAESKDFGTLGRLDRIEEAKKDVLALIKLNAAIERNMGGRIPTQTDLESQRHASTEKSRTEEAALESNKLIDAGLLGINVEVALKAIDDAQNKGQSIDFVNGSVLGLSIKQRDKLLEHYGFKPKEQPQTLTPRKVRPEMSGGERLRRRINGSNTKPNVPGRHALEDKVGYAKLQLKADDALPTGSKHRLSERKRRHLEKIIEKAPEKTASGSIFNPEKYGVGATATSIAERANIYTTDNVRLALRQLAAERAVIDDYRAETKRNTDLRAYGLFATKMHNAFHREAIANPNTPVDPPVQLNEAVFTQIVKEVEKNFDGTMAKRLAALPNGERLKDHEINSIYIDSQLTVARELADLDFDQRGVPKEGTQYTTRVRQLLESFHSYIPARDEKGFTKEFIEEARSFVAKAATEGAQNYKKAHNMDPDSRLDKEVVNQITSKAIERFSKTELARRLGVNDPVILEAGADILAVELAKLRKKK